MRREPIGTMKLLNPIYWLRLLITSIVALVVAILNK